MTINASATAMKVSSPMKSTRILGLLTVTQHGIGAVDGRQGPC
ncbi:hypothetical protein [Luteipulveratus mongoliensis]|nr:hypothetical protein [Luteipulveratus mongoliensis]